MDFAGKINESARIEIYDVLKFEKLKKNLMGKDIMLTLRLLYSKRSLDQNSYYWAVVLPYLARGLGYTVAQAHEACKRRYLSTNLDSPYPTVRSTTDLSRLEFADYLTHIQCDASQEVGVYIPDPNEVYYPNIYKEEEDAPKIHN
jgi:hypothetical protein